MAYIRELRADEIAFVEEMLWTALAWRPGVELPPREIVLAHPQVVVFHVDWGRVGDLGLVAEENGEPIGLVWYRFFTEEAHGEGYVDDETPELAIAVRDGHRSRGVGAQLMEAIHERARAAGEAQISLSVNLDNPARRLYERLGYVELEPGDEDGKMVLQLA